MAEQKPIWQEMGLTASEYDQICELLGRDPNYLETGLLLCSGRNTAVIRIPDRY